MSRFQKMLFTVAPYTRIMLIYDDSTSHIHTWLHVVNKIKSKEVLRKWRQKNEKIVHKLKINGCAICGYNKCDAALEFHHVNSKNKKYCIVRDSISRKDIVQEMRKCILLCANCHKEIHKKEKLNE